MKDLNKPMSTPPGDLNEDLQGRQARGHSQADEAPGDSEDRFHALADAAFEGIVILDQGRILEANRPCAAMFRYNLSDIIGKSGLELVAPESRELVQQRIASGYDQPYEGVALRKDGTTFPVEIRGKPLLYQGRTVRVTAVRDITGRKQAEEALVQSSRRNGTTCS